MTKTQFAEVVALCKDELDSHYYATERRFVRASGEVVKFDAEELDTGERVLVSATPVIWAIIDNGADVTAITEYRQIVNHYSFVALIPDAAGKQHSWVPLTKDETSKTWKFWKL